MSFVDLLLSAHPGTPDGLATLATAAAPDDAAPAAAAAPPATPPAPEPPPRDEEAELQKARDIYALEQKVARLEEAVALAQRQRDRSHEKSEAEAAQVAGAKSKLADVEAGLSKLRAGGERLLKDIKLDIDTSRARVSILEEEGRKKECAREEAAELYQRETDVLRLELSRGVADKEHGDTETRLLMRVLHSERDKWEHNCRELAAKLEVQIREDAKNTILLGLLNSQLLAARAEGSRLSDDQFALLRKQRSLEADLAAKQERAGMLKRDLMRSKRDHTARCDEHAFRVMRMTQEHERQKTTVSALGAELSSQQEVLSAAVAQASAKDRERQECIARNRAELAKYRSTVGQLHTRVRELHEEGFAQGSIRATEIEKLQIARQGWSATQDSKSMQDFQTIAEQSSQIEVLKAQLEMAEQKRHKFEDEAEVRLAEIRVQTEAQYRQTVVLRAHSEDSEREGTQMIAKLAAANQALQRRIKELHNNAADRDEQHVAERVSTRSEAERHSREVKQLEGSVDQHSRDHCERMVALQQERSLLIGREGTRADDMKKEKQNLRDRIDVAARERITQGQVLRTHELQSHRQVAYHNERETAFKAEMRALKQEVNEGRDAVQVLEAKVAETHGFRVLAEENTLLERDLKDCRAQIAAHENTIATMRVEKDLLEGYKTKVLKEQNAKHVKKLTQLDDKTLVLRPLVQELVVTAAKHHVADEAVQATLRCARGLGLGIQLHPAPPAVAGVRGLPAGPAGGPVGAGYSAPRRAVS
eukprot:TRINITY_DN8636_c0_g1_i1.p1 TRINITY_DN8636_c0_g1~~TRINITY_DN8636_c0_g1_i1.p1  ORF type:complete len:763 (+),score=254.16 TRINITY_DN8636_c0_g1_i1:65-2353(+)